jgi:uncharacterized protein YndB with AHSA1/START domain
MTIISPAPVRKSIRVNVSAARAFDVFTSDIGRWWPASHTILKSPLARVVIEPFAEGRWFHLGEDGSESDNGRVLAWEPPHRLLLAWQLNADWQYDPHLITEVEVKFIREDEHTTRVELEHRLLERMGAKGEIARAMVDAPGGWSAILELYRQHADD